MGALVVASAEVGPDTLSVHGASSPRTLSLYLVVLKLLWAMTSISEDPSEMMPGLSAETFGDGNQGPLPVLVPSCCFLMVWPSRSSPFCSCTHLLPGQCCFCEGLLSLCLWDLNRRILSDLRFCLCVYRCVLHFSFWSILGVSLWYSTEITEPESEFPTRNLYFATH